MKCEIVLVKTILCEKNIPLRRIYFGKIIKFNRDNIRTGQYAYNGTPNKYKFIFCVKNPEKKTVSLAPNSFSVKNQMEIIVSIQ